MLPQPAVQRLTIGACRPIIDEETDQYHLTHSRGSRRGWHRTLERMREQTGEKRAQLKEVFQDKYDEQLGKVCAGIRAILGERQDSREEDLTDYKDAQEVKVMCVALQPNLHRLAELEYFSQNIDADEVEIPTDTDARCEAYSGPELGPEHDGIELSEETDRVMRSMATTSTTEPSPEKRALEDSSAPDNAKRAKIKEIFETKDDEDLIVVSN